MTVRLDVECPDCGAPMPPGTETCPIAHLHARKVCDRGRSLWAKMSAADDAGEPRRARMYARQFYEHRAKCESCNAAVER